jgi:hypothetical protein
MSDARESIPVKKSAECQEESEQTKSAQFSGLRFRPDQALLSTILNIVILSSHEEGRMSSGSKEIHSLNERR